MFMSKDQIPKWGGLQTGIHSPDYNPDLAEFAGDDYSGASPANGQTENGLTDETNNSAPKADLSSLRSYLKEVAKNPLLQANEEIELARLIKSGNQYAKRQLISANLRLVISIAKRYARHGLELEDLIQEGNLGLIQAAAKYDPSKGTRFSTYATWWVRQAIQRALSNKSRAVRIPIHITQMMFRLKKAARPFFQKLGRAPTLEELASETGLNLSELEHVLKSHMPMLSLDESIGSQSDDTLDKIVSDESTASPEEEIELQLLSRCIQNMLLRLSAEERQVVELRYGIGNSTLPTDLEIASALHTDSLFVRRATIRAMRKLRKWHRLGKISDYLN